MERYKITGTLSKGPLGWWNQYNGGMQTIAEEVGHLEIARFSSATGKAGYRGYPVSLNVPPHTIRNVNSPYFSKVVKQPIADVAYSTASTRDTFLGLMWDSCSGNDTYVRVLLLGLLAPYAHGFPNNTLAYLPVITGDPLTNVNTGGQPVGYFMSSAVGTADPLYEGIYLNP